MQVLFVAQVFTSMHSILLVASYDIHGADIYILHNYTDQNDSNLKHIYSD